MVAEGEYKKVLQVVSAWALEDRAALVRELARGLRDRPPQPPPRDTLSRAQGLLRTELPPPSDEDVKRWIDEYRTYKYGSRQLWSWPLQMMTVLLDMNVVLDVLLERHPFFDRSSAIWKACDEGRLRGHVSAITLTTIFYVARKIKGADEARQAVELCLDAFAIVPVDRQVLQTAARSGGRDFEDDVQIACAQAIPVDAIVTRDQTGFVASPIPVLTPAEALGRISAP